MDRLARLLAAAVLAVAPAAAQPANPPFQQDHQRWRSEAERRLVACEQHPATEQNCRSTQRMFLDVYRKAMDGESGY